MKGWCCKLEFPPTSVAPSLNMSEKLEQSSNKLEKKGLRGEVLKFTSFFGW